MISPSAIQPDVALRDYLKGKVFVASDPVSIFSSWERPTNGLPTDFIVIFINGNVGGVGTGADYAEGAIMLNLYCKMNDDGSVKNNRVNKILAQFDTLIDKKVIGKYHFAYAADRFITPTTPNQSSGYSTTSLNLNWHTVNNFKTN